LFISTIIGAFIRLFDEKTTISLEQVDGISNLPSFTLCPYPMVTYNDSYEKFEANKNLGGPGESRETFGGVVKSDVG
jgi:hypothetical protein